MPSYWPDKPHKPAYRSGLDRVLYSLYCRFGFKSHFWVRRWSEHEVFRILRVLARQQMFGFVANPEGGDPIWYLDAPEDVQENRYPLNACLLRGWIEELDRGSQSYKGFPIAQPLGFFDDFPKPPYYRLTAAGWNALKGAYTVSRIALMVSAIGLLVSLVSFVISVSRGKPTPTLAANPTLAATPTPAATPAVVKPQLPKDEQGRDMPTPEIVRSEQVQIDNHEVKTVTVGNANGEYVLSCNMKAENCQTPVPAKNYYVFNKTTKWKFLGATGYVTLKWLQEWSVSYPNGENIALVPSDGGQPEEVGMYWLSSWTASDKQK